VETALLKVNNNLLTACDQEKCAILVLLDLSAAFDTVDHTILLERLRGRFGIQGTAFKWIKSYLSGRSNSVKIQNSKSDPHSHDYNVPQGSVLGPQLFGDYTSPLEDIMNEQSSRLKPSSSDPKEDPEKDENILGFHLYADDNQIYVIFDPNSETSLDEAVSILEAVIADIRSWITSNYLKLNNDKTEVLVIGSSYNLKKKVKPFKIQIGNHDIIPSLKARNIGVEFETTLSMAPHVANCAKSLWYHLYNISRIKQYLDQKAMKTLVHALITSKMDFCNSLLFNIPQTHLEPMERVQRAAARMISKASKFDDALPLMQELHWLPVRQRIVFKILLLAYKSQHNLAPEYLSDIISPYVPNRELRSSKKCYLTPSSPKTSYGERTFSYAAPKLWKDLPLELKQASTLASFKSSLKTLLFREAYL